MVGPVAQKRVEGLSRFEFLAFEGAPCRSQQLVSPALDKVTVAFVFIGGRWGRDRLPCQLLRLPLFAAFQIDNQMAKSRLEKVAEAAALRVGAVKIATQESQRELLGQLIGGVRIA